MYTEMSAPPASVRGMKKLHMPYIQITSAALNLYAAEGPKGVTMRRVAKCVGVSAAALYRHFRNKDAMMDAVAGEADTWLGDSLASPRRQKARTNRVRAVAERAVQFAIDHPRIFELAARRKPNWHRPPSHSAANMVRHEVDEAMRARQIHREPPDRVTRAVCAQLYGLVSLKERGELDQNAAVLRDQWIGAADRLLYGLVAT